MQKYEMATRMLRERVLRVVPGVEDVAVSYGIITFWLRMDTVSDVTLWQLKQAVMDVAGIDTGKVEITGYGDGEGNTMYVVSMHYNPNPQELP